ncbi:glycosyltransferase family 4 protein [Plectonema cf. radiosum LEGE 06105]|uniref:Glycosyltransferase family 4 protein n=1 Tax=Plectonema cf. radiosum LEGE 06105 TaxID=945769 RepID=A0A8J7K219_9CYAN|nr:glycosyltransferase family 4 protein [Plectonema radiosum]MBE9212592.1 glycosyltransferase family 4 protein [Plectonema cf. radiosum LEGE 06105]
MKILLLNDVGTATGGAETQMLSLRDNLRSLSHDVRLFSSKAKPVADSPLLCEYSCFGTNSLFQVISQTANVSAYLNLRRVLNEFQPDVVHVRMFMWQLSPLILPLLEKIPCLYQTAVYKAICPLGTKLLPDGSPCKYKAGKACLNHGCLTPQSWTVFMVQRQLWLRWRHVFNTVVALSHAMKVNLEADGIAPVKVVHNGVPQRKQRPPLREPATVVFAGRLVSEKGVDVLLKAFARVKVQVPLAQLIIAGQGVEAANLTALAEELGINESVKWLGHIPREELEQQFDAAWVQVVPSLWAEPFGNVTTEAMMRGTAVIASSTGAQPEIVNHDQTGFLVPPGDVAALGNALIKLLSNRELAEEMGQAGRKRAIEEFSEQRRTQGFLDIYQEIISSGSRE